MTDTNIPAEYAIEFRGYLNAIAAYDAAARDLQSTPGFTDSEPWQQAACSLREAEKGLKEAALNLAAGVYTYHTGQEA
jgi:hypothetical protein